MVWATVLDCPVTPAWSVVKLAALRMGVPFARGELTATANVAVNTPPSAGTPPVKISRPPLSSAVPLALSLPGTKFVCVGTMSVKTKPVASAVPLLVRVIL